MKRKQFIKLTGATGTFTMLGGAAWLLQSCNGQNKNSMHNNGDYYFGGMHMGWWFLMLVLLIGILVLFNNSRKRK